MSNTRHTNGRANTAAVPPSPDVAERSLANVIGESVALHLGQMLGQLLPQMPWQPECFFCVQAARQKVRAYQASVDNAIQAAEPVPDPPEPPHVAKALTSVPLIQMVQTEIGLVASTATVPACWDHVQTPGEGPRPTGLVAPDGRPIVAKRQG